MAELSLLPNGMQQFCDENGVPYLAGTVGMYVPNTLTYKDNWQDQDHFALNEDPITLDAAGRCVIWGEGNYRQILKDLNGNTIWDKLTRFTDPASESETVYDLPIFIGGFPDDGEVFPIVTEVRATELPAGLTNSQFYIEDNPTATMTFTIQKNGLSIGTVAFSTLGVPTVTFVADVGFVAGDRFSLVAPSPQDLTGANVSFTFVFTVL